jgi:hypothetical protein
VCQGKGVVGRLHAGVLELYCTMLRRRYEVLSDSILMCLATLVLSVHASRQVIMKYQRRTVKAAMYDGRLLVTLASAVDQLVAKGE